VETCCGEPPDASWSLITTKKGNIVSAEKKTINGTVYAFGIIPPTEAVKVEVTIARVISEPLFKAAVAVKGKKGSKNDMLAAAAQAVGTLASKMDADELIETINVVMKYVSAGDKRILNIDEHFVGKNAELWQVFIEALTVNFSDFFTGSLFDSIREAMPPELS
jgi:hypothetical protein